MNINKFTEKAQEAILAAQQLAESNNNTQLEMEHLLYSLLAQSDGVVPQILRKLGIDAEQVKQQVGDEIGRLPKAYGPVQLSFSHSLKQVFDIAQRETERLKDEYVST